MKDKLQIAFYRTIPRKVSCGNTMVENGNSLNVSMWLSQKVAATDRLTIAAACWTEQSPWKTNQCLEYPLRMLFTFC